MAALTFIGAGLLLALLQLDAIVREHQGPLDHVATSLLAPYYGLSCPAFSHDDVPRIAVENESSVAYRDCNTLSGTKCRFPRIFMIGARGENEDTFQTWHQLLDREDGDRPRVSHLQRINTLKMSNRYALSGGASAGNSNATATKEVNSKLCRTVKWEHRLFAVYQTVFANLLATYPDEDGFVIVEDDAVLMDASAFAHEVCGAHRHQLDFYSLYRSPLQSKGRRSVSCIYQHGTVAFYVRRHVMEGIVNERRRGVFCRFPIDMYISRMGPWYATTRDVVRHAEKGGRVGSTS